MFNTDYYREERNRKMEIGSLFGAKHASNVHGVKDDDTTTQKQEKSKFPPDWFANAVAAQGGGFQQ